MTAKNNLEKLVTSIWDKLGTHEQNKMIHPFEFEKLEQYQIIVGFPTLAKTPKIEFIGYPVQVRKKIGAFNSDLVMIRHLDGTLSTWENQGFLKLTEEELKIATPFFKNHIEDDKNSSDIGFTIHNEFREIGYIIENSNYKSNISQTVTITKSNDNNILEQTVIVS